MELLDTVHGRPSTREFWALARSCPVCLGFLETVMAGRDVHWRCAECGRCWDLTNTRLHRVDPIGCSGCGGDCRDTCMTVLQQEFPRFGPDDLEFTNLSQ